MKKCPACGKPMEDEEKFCASCGAKYEEPPQGPTEAATPAFEFCPNCGERLPKGTEFCPNCGAGLRAGQGPAKDTSKTAKVSLDPRTVGIIAVCAGVAVVVLVVALIMSAVGGSPSKKFVNYQKKLVVDEALDLVAAAADQYNAGTDFSTDLTLTANCRNADLREALEDSSVTVKADISKNSLLLNADLTLMGSPVLSGALTYEKGRLGIYLPEVDDSYYVADLEKLMDMSGQDVQDVSDIEIPQISTEKLVKLGRAYFDILASAVTKENVERSSKDRIRLGELGESMSGELYVFEPEAEDIEAMLLKLADRLETDKDLRDFVKDLVGSNQALLEEAGEEDILDSLDDALSEAAEYLEDNAEYLGERLEDSGFTWTLGVSKGEIVLEKIEMDGGSTGIALEMTEGEAVLYETSYGGVQQVLTLEYKKDGKLWEGSAEMPSEGLTIEFEDVEMSKKSVLNIPYGSYTIEEYGEALELEVIKGEKGGTDHIITLPGMYLGYDYVEGLELVVHTTDKRSTASKPKGKTVDVSDYDQDELAEIVEDISEDLQQVFMEAGAGLYGSDW